MTLDRAWRGRVRVVRLGPLDSLGAAAGSVVAIAIGVVLAIGFGLGLYAIGWIAPRLTLAVGAAPLVAWIWWRRRRRALHLEAPSAEAEVVASPGLLVVEGRPHPVRGVGFAGEVLVARGWLATVDLRVTHAEALAILDALRVPDVGVRTIVVRGPVASVPVLGPAVFLLAPLVVCFSGSVLGFASHLNDGVRPVFALVLVVSAILAFVSAARRSVVVAESGIVVRWIGRVTRIGYAELERIALDGGALVVSVKGRRPWRLPLTMPSHGSATAAAEAEAIALRLAAGPVSLASARGIATVFE